jgi:hypothetical protein
VLCKYGAVCFIDKVGGDQVDAEICKNYGEERKHENIISVLFLISGAAKFPTEVFLH